MMLRLVQAVLVLLLLTLSLVQQGIALGIESRFSYGLLF